MLLYKELSVLVKCLTCPSSLSDVQLSNIETVRELDVDAQTRIFSRFRKVWLININKTYYAYQGKYKQNDFQHGKQTLYPTGPHKHLIILCKR